MTVPALSRYRANRRALLVTSGAATTLGWCISAQALPQGGIVVDGSALIANTATTTTVTQSSTRAFVDWSSFNVSKNETVQFNQPGAWAITFNRVDPSSFSTI